LIATDEFLLAEEAELLERRHSSAPSASFEYFVHYKCLNRRLDEWVTPERIALPAISPASSAASIGMRKTSSHRASTSSHAPRHSVDGGGESPVKRTRHQKRVHNEINHVPVSYEEMDPTTAALEREHEMVGRRLSRSTSPSLQLTRVKYIKQITLGKFEIDTWYVHMRHACIRTGTTRPTRCPTARRPSCSCASTASSTCSTRSRTACIWCVVA